MSDETQDSTPTPAQHRPAVVTGGIHGIVGSSAGGAGVLGLFLALQSAGIIPSEPKEPPKSTEEIRREIAQEQARASLLEHLQQSARSNAERLTQLATVMGNLEESIGDLEEETKRTEAAISSKLSAEVGFLLSRCLDDPPKKKRKRRRRRPVDDEDDEEADD